MARNEWIRSNAPGAPKNFPSNLSIPSEVAFTHGVVRQINKLFYKLRIDDPIDECHISTWMEMLGYYLGILALFSQFLFIQHPTTKNIQISRHSLHVK